MLRNKFPALICVIITIATTASTALAQGSPSPAPETGKLVSYGIAVLATLAVIGLSMMSAKRTHQD